jgi:hypothetical protein
MQCGFRLVARRGARLLQSSYPGTGQSRLFSGNATKEREDADFPADPYPKHV